MAQPVTNPTLRPSHTAKVLSILEVLLAFALVHVGFRAIKHFTQLGRFEVEAHLNFTPGAVMILFTLSLLLLTRRNFAAYGLTLAQWPANLKLGLLWGILLVAGAGLLHCLGVRHLPGAIPPTMTEGIIYSIACLAALLAFGWILRRQQTLLERIPLLLCFLVLFLALWLPLSFALQFGWPFGQTLLTVLWLVLGAACGEEIFCRGYLQSRVNQAFGRPFRFLGTAFGPGLIVSSLLFASLHALNTVDYFTGRFTLAWGFGLTNLFTGLLYGFLREATGSLLAPIVAHTLLDVLVIIPVIISRP